MLKRIWLYLQEMFPPIHILPTLLMPFSFFAMVAQLNHFELPLSSLLWRSSFSVVLFMLMLRVMDEFKDYQDDLTNYPGRPLPSGRVLHQDLKVLLTVIIAVLMALNLDPLPVSFAAALVFAYSVLMFKWFFIEEKMRKSLPLALISHNPIVYIYLFYIFVVYTQMDPGYQWTSIVAIVPMAAPMTQWEIARKIRLPQNETVYTTYSKVWGFRRSLQVCLVIQAVILIGMNLVMAKVSAPLWLHGVFTLAFLSISAVFVRFMGVQEDPENRWHKVIPVRRYAEWQGLLVQVTAVAAYLLRYFNN